SQVGQPQVPVTYQVVLQNTGTQATTYDLGLENLPTDGSVSGTISPASITLQPGQVTPGSNGVPKILVTVTSDSATQLAPFSFTVEALAEGASEINRTTTGQFAARSALVQVASVSTNPPFTDPGGHVDVTASILNAVNRQQQGQASYTVTDA